MKKNASVELTNFLGHYKYYLLLIAIVLFVFGNSISNGYNMDDNLVTQNHQITSQKSFSALYDIFTSPYYKDDLGNSYGYRPLILLSFFIEHSIFGESPMISHFFNLFFYALVVVLFFVLLVRLFGEKGLVLGLLSAFLFAVHPIHTEVVASIKNRDEILAFLFVLLAVLSIENYIKKSSFISLIAISIFFSLGMLSKKSIYPMVLILPIAIIFFKEISIKQLSLLVIAIIFPAAVIGSNLVFNRLIIISLIPSLIIYFIYYLKTGRLELTDLFEKRRTNILIIIISWVLLILSVWQKSYYISTLLIGFSMFVVIKNDFWTVFQVVLQLVILTFFMDSKSFSIAALFICLSDFIKSFTNNKPDKKSFYLSILILMFFVIKNFEINYVLIYLSIILFFYFVFRKPLWGFYYSLVAFFVSICFWGFDFLIILMLVYSIMNFVNSNKNNHHFKSISHAIILLVLLINTIIPLSFSVKFINLSDYFVNNQHEEAVSAISQIALTPTKNFMHEGRPLEYIENTLVVPHSLSETIGTGFITLGEYARLMVFPKELSFYYGYAKIKTTGLNNIWVWCSIVFYLGLILLAIWQANRRPMITIGVIWFVISILLFSNWTELVAGMVGERLAFTASAGFSILFAGIVMWIKPDFSFKKPRGVELVVFAILILFAGRTIARNKDWKDPITLMSHDIKHLENSAQANNLYAIFLMKEAAENNQLSQDQRLAYRQKAISHFKQSIKVYPYFFNANYDLGRAYYEVGDLINASAAFENAHKIMPDNLIAVEELAKINFDLKDKDGTEYYCNKFLDKDPSNENLHELVAYMMLVNNDRLKAQEYAQRGLLYFPQNQNLRMILSESLK